MICPTVRGFSAVGEKQDVNMSPKNTFDACSRPIFPCRNPTNNQGWGSARTREVAWFLTEFSSGGTVAPSKFDGCSSIFLGVRFTGGYHSNRLGGKLDCAAILGPGPLASVEVVKQLLERPRMHLHCPKVVTRKHQSIRQPGDIGLGPNLFIPWMTHTCFTHDTVDGSEIPPFGWWFFTL